MVGPAKTINRLTSGATHVSKRLLASYIIDWILIIATAAVGGVFSKIDSARHAFSLQDPTISFPYHDDTVTVAVLLVVVIVAPGVITAVISLVVVPGPTVGVQTPQALIWRHKLWEWNAAWMGLGVALAGAFMITEGLKDLSGKPRPFMLAVCNPDTSPSAIRRYQVGGLGASLEAAVPIVVDWHICRNSNKSQMRNAFASWPSGHSSFAWAGLLYLSLFLCAKFAVHIPLLLPQSYSKRYISTFDEEVTPPDSKERRSTSPPSNIAAPHPLSPRNEAAAPPIYLLILVFIPIGVALFISVSRWFDYRHHGFDIISGSLIGIFTAWFGFRWYHLPIRGGGGWAWGARSRDRAFWLGIGRASYAGDEGWDSAKAAPRDDLEAAAMTERGPTLGGPQQPAALNHSVRHEAQGGRAMTSPGDLIAAQGPS